MLEIGSIIDGKYKILNVIGKGGMSVVYLAMNERANKQWAIKEVRKDGMQNYEVVKQNLIVETDLLKKLNHPHLPSIIDVIDGDGTFLIVMDYIEGNPLSKALETSGAQSQEDVIEWAKQLCDVLGYLHSRKPPIIYRDMKPSNVMLKPDGNVMLIDFGTAREFKSTSVADTTCLGTQGYAAPEQFGGHGQTDARTDIYCLGATMYHLVTGHNPCTPPYEMYPIRQWNPMLSSGLEEIILKCTQRNPNDRYQSCAELLYALDHYTDLDIENKKVQSFKWKTFIASLLLTLVMLVSSIALGVITNIQKASTYDSLIRQAKNYTISPNEEENSKGKDSDEKLELYKQAISLEPARIDAYEDLYEDYINSGGDDINKNYTQDEHKKMCMVIKQNEETLLSENPKEYVEKIAYKIGRRLFFTEDVDWKVEWIKESYSWFEKVIAENDRHGNIDSHIVDTSKKLMRVAELYKKAPSTLEQNVDAGERRMDFKEYFNELKGLLDIKWENQENSNEIVRQNIISVERFVARELDSKFALFTDSQSGVSIASYKDLYNTLRSKVEDDFQGYSHQMKRQNAALDHIEQQLNGIS